MIAASLEVGEQAQPPADEHTGPAAHQACTAVKHIFQIDKAEDSTCLHCGQDDESVHHFLFDCATWRHERWPMSNILGRAAKEANSVMNTLKGVAELMKFVGCTGRFKGTLGELL